MLTFVEYDIKQEIAGKPGNLPLPYLGLEDKDHPLIPKAIPDFIPPTFGADIITGFRLHEPIFIYGPTGCAKTASVHWLCNKLHLPLLSVTGHSRLELQDLLGHYILRQGETVWQDGPLTLALRHGTIFLFDELTLTPPETLVGLHGLLDGHDVMIPDTGEILPVPETFLFVATDNTNGSGDETGAYAGTLNQNMALLNRFFFVKADYLPHSMETTMLKKHCPYLDDTIVQRMLQFATDVRSNPNLTTTVSVRDLFRWGKTIDALSYAKAKISIIKKALNHAILYRASEGDMITLQDLAEQIFGRD